MLWLQCSVLFLLRGVLKTAAARWLPVAAFCLPSAVCIGHRLWNPVVHAPRIAP